MVLMPPGGLFWILHKPLGYAARSVLLYRIKKYTPEKMIFYPVGYVNIITQTLLKIKRKSRKHAEFS